MLKPEHLEKGDNLRLVQRHNVPTAVAALTFVKWVEADVAVQRVERWDEKADDAKPR